VRTDRTRRRSLEPNRWPKWAKAAATFKTAEDKGVGDTIKRMLGTAGIFFEATMKTLGVPCHCPERREEFNARFPYS